MISTVQLDIAHFNYVNSLILCQLIIKYTLPGTSSHTYATYNELLPENYCQIKVFPSLVRKNTSICLFGV